MTLAAAPHFTPREQGVLELLCRGEVTWDHEIAARLCISPLTAQYHVRNLMSKLGASSRAQLIAYAWTHGLLEEHA